MAWVYGTTVIEQRCIFHKMRNVSDACRKELTGETKKQERTKLMTQVSTIYQAESAAEAQTRLATFAQDWQGRTPKTVDTLQRDFEQTIAYYQLEGVAQELVRTTSLEDAHQSRVAAQVSSSLLLWQSKECGSGHLFAGRAVQCSLVEADLVGDLPPPLLRVSHSPLLAMDTLP